MTEAASVLLVGGGFIFLEFGTGIKRVMSCSLGPKSLIWWQPISLALLAKHLKLFQGFSFQKNS